ncbi:hypothetical protein SLS55_000600 [Diplodia seriata]|uniref:Uncharacterized protein n=1 Tax=Diplodia seriata TaxID=420778 RepID=A0A1S8B435_9PEZI|nr:hypothetical protein BK809_0006637 [Diplodia seriata]
MGGFFISRTWRTRKIMLGLLLLEFALTVPVLTLFGIANPNLYRTKLWQEGGDLGYNSAPNTVLYAEANYRPVKTPLIWNQFITSWNLVISVLSMFIMLTKIPMFVMHVFYPIISLFVHALEIALYAYSAYGQSGKDTIDPRRPSTGLPWYIGKSCSVATSSQLKGYCLQAKSAFVLTCLMIVLFSIFFILAIHSMIPTKAQREQHDERVHAKAERKSKFEAMKAELAAEAASIHQQQLQMTNEQYWAQQGHPISPAFAPTSPYAAQHTPYGPPSATYPPRSPFTPGGSYAQWQQNYGSPQSAQPIQPVQPAPMTHYGPDGQVDWSRQQWEMQNYPQPPVSPVHTTSPSPPLPAPAPYPVTPRTKAYNSLNGSGDLPLRQA